MGWSLYGVVAIWGGRYMGWSTIRGGRYMGWSLYGVVAIWGGRYMGWSLYGVVAIWSLYVWSLYGVVAILEMVSIESVSAKWGVRNKGGRYMECPAIWSVCYMECLLYGGVCYMECLLYGSVYYMECQQSLYEVPTI